MKSQRSLVINGEGPPVWGGRGARSPVLVRGVLGTIERERGMEGGEGNRTYERAKASAKAADEN